MDESWSRPGGAGPPRVLAAEDVAVNRFLLDAFLSRLGCRHDIVENGRAAVEAFAAGRYDFVLMDIRMPEMDGKTALTRLRAAGAAPGRPAILAMTAHALEAERAALLAFGFDGLLPKPFTLDDLAAALGLVPAGA